MKARTGAVLLLLAAMPAWGHYPHEREIHRASELVPWCRQEAEARYLGRGESPRQWSARYSDRGDTLSVEGRLRVEGRDVQVKCRITRGAREQYATIEFDDPKG